MMSVMCLRQQWTTENIVRSVGETCELQTDLRTALHVDKAVQGTPLQEERREVGMSKEKQQHVTGM